jgi:AcrR family transcriptional regulator
MNGSSCVKGVGPRLPTSVVLDSDVEQLYADAVFLKRAFQKYRLSAMRTETSRTKMGRPRGFTEAQALEAAMLLFWSKGYEGATTNDLAHVMGINASSMYAAFGSKEELFKRAVVRYCDEHMIFFPAALALPTMNETVRAVLAGMIDLVSKPGYPQGCLTIQSGMATTESIRVFLNGYRKQGEDALKRRVERAKKESDLDPKLNSGDFARYLVMLTTGMSVQAANGTSKAELKRQADLALRYFGYKPLRRSQ